ncbi:MAG: hypothetical protein IJC98_09050 [Clostridia bacterium]|nr:hypothetical protein [Clostridia bacterium]
MIEYSAFVEKPKFHWAFHAHMGFNFFEPPIGEGTAASEEIPAEHCAEEHLRFDLDLFHMLTERLAAAGCNTIVLDIGEAMQYESHPRIACRGALSKDILREEIFNLKMRGIEVIPKLNFSTFRDVWMGEYRSGRSSPAYYGFCEDVIAEVCEVFGRPRLLHLGMETVCDERPDVTDVRLAKDSALWWKDLLFLAQTAMHYGARPWVWSDVFSADPAAFLKRMPRDIVQSVRFFGKGEALERDRLSCAQLDREGYDQIPCGCFAPHAPSLADVTDVLDSTLSEGAHLGYLQTVSLPTMPHYRGPLLCAADAIAAAHRA